jgi:3-oxoacyl-[acyl-carrier-protein] synthase III
VLVIGADVMSSIIDYTDRATCVLFGDGAGRGGAGRVGRPRGRHPRLRAQIDGSGGPALCMPAGGSKRPASRETVDERLHFVKQEGQAVFKFAVRNTGDICERILQRNHVTANELDLFVSHQANKRIIMSAAERIGMPEDKVIINIDRFGNTTAATIPLALNDAVNRVG